MNRKKRMQGKLLVSIIGLIILLLIASTYLIRQKVLQPEGEYITVTEVRNEMQALAEVNPENPVFGKNEALLEDTEAYLTYQDAKQMMEFTESSSPFTHRYASDSYVLLTDWNLYLDQLIDSYGKEEIIRESLVLIAAGENVSDEEDKSPEADEILTKNGIYTDLSKRAGDFLCQEIEGVTYKNQILAITRSTQPEITLKNVYITAAEDSFLFFFHHYEIRMACSDQAILEACAGPDEKIADITLENSQVRTCQLKTDIINGKIVKITAESAEIEGYGILPFSEDVSVYQLYGNLCSKTTVALRIGYSFTDFVLEKGEIAACLIVKDEDMDAIRVLIRNSDYEGKYHDSVEVNCDYSYQIVYYRNGREERTEKKQAGEATVFQRPDMEKQTERAVIRPDILSGTLKLVGVTRSQGTPAYHGTLEIEQEKEGFLVINEVSLEDYLYQVVPSEMPSSYPLEALKAQAVCARTYAYGKMLSGGLASYGAHVDDSAGFQVYSNIEAQPETTKAVKATMGEILMFGEEPIGAYYYSTSCGVGTDVNIWKSAFPKEVPYLAAREISAEGTEEFAERMEEESAFLDFIKSVNTEDYESQDGWYRWRYIVDSLDVSHMEETLKSRYASYPDQILTLNKNGVYESCKIPSLGKIKDIAITKRNIGGIADELVITGTKATIQVIGELNIRYVLNDGASKVLRQSGDEVAAPKTLPSSFFVIETGKEKGYVIGYTLSGGGFGHGVGMSQNGAKAMAERGMAFEAILSFFYKDSEMKKIRSEGE